jgi:EAL domain-containing protein (putative c-di-GMP-specific phosphodiesterase class I)/DNA-binding NarL/FixJ family response regulator
MTKLAREDAMLPTTIRHDELTRLDVLAGRLNASALVIALQPDGRLLQANAAALALVAAALPDVAGQPFAGTPWARHIEDGARVVRRMLEAARRGEQCQLPVPLKTAEGQRITIDFTLRPVADRNGVTAFIVLTGRDVPERLRDTADRPDRASPDRTLHAALREAVARRRFQLEFQPQASVADGSIVGVEALLRWQDRSLRTQSPQRLRQALASASLDGLVGEWTLQQACETARTWQDAGLGPLRTTVGVSAAQLRGNGFATRVEQLLDSHGLAPHRLGLELSDVSAVQDVDATAEALQHLRQRGVTITLAGFGAGGTSLDALRTLPIDIVKIDRGLLPAGGGGGNRPLADAVIAMAHGLGMQVLAEGVATEAQLDLLHSAGCDLFQGDHWCAPLTTEALQALLRTGHALPSATARHQPTRVRRILVVDDEAALAHCIGEKLLRHFGGAVDVEACSDPADALCRLRRQAYDIVVCDLGMPEMDGIALLGHARELQPDALRIMLLGPSDLARVIDAEHQVDVFRYLPKPWSSKQFQAHFQAALQQLDQAQAKRALHGGAPPARAEPIAASAPPRRGAEGKQARSTARPTDIGTEWSLPSQLPTLPGDLWALPDQAAGDALIVS